MFPTNPPNSTSKVCNLLKKNTDLKVYHKDLSLTIWKILLSKDFLSRCELHEERLHYSEVGFCEKVSKGKFKAIQTNVLENIEEAKRVLKDKQLFADMDTLSWAINVIAQAQQIIYNTYGTLIHNKMIFWPEINANTNDIEKVYQYSTDYEHNPLIEVMEHNIIQELVQLKPDIIGIDILFPWEIVQVVTLNHLIKKYLPKVHINYIGFGFDEFCYSRIADNLTDNKRLMLGFDSVFLVRNDRALMQLYANPTSDKNLLESIAFYTNEGEIQVNGPLYEAVIDQSVIPDYSGLDLKEYFSPEVVFTDKLSNKCFWNKCTFCNINKFKSERCEISIEEYLKQVEIYMNRYGCSNLFLLDEAATPSLVKKFAKGILKKGLKFTWSIRTRIDKGYDEELIQLMYEAGCREMWIGFEAASPSVLKSMNKTENPDEYLETATKEMQRCQKYGIGLHFCLILGFPNEVESDRQLLKKFFVTNRKYISRVPFFVTFNCFNLNSETYIYDHYKDFGIREVQYNPAHFNMINIPFIREDTKKLQSELEEELEPFCDELADVFVRKLENKLLWFTIADSCWEMLFKKYNNDGNPFQQEATKIEKMVVKLAQIASKNPMFYKICSKKMNSKNAEIKSTLYH